MKYLAALMIVLMLSVFVQAKELKGLKFEDQLKVADVNLVLNGLGVRKAFGMFDVYVAGLYVEKSSRDAQAILDSKSPKKLILKFKRFVEKSKMRDAWTEGFLKNAAKSYSYKEDLKLLNEAMSSHLRGIDSMTFTFFADRAEVQLKDLDAVKIKGADFSYTMLKVFLGSPPDESLKTGILGL